MYLATSRVDSRHSLVSCTASCARPNCCFRRYQAFKGETDDKRSDDGYNAKRRTLQIPQLFSQLQSKKGECLHTSVAAFDHGD